MERPICTCTRMGRMQIRRFLDEWGRPGPGSKERDLPTLLDFQLITGAGRRCTGCAIDLALTFASERRRKAEQLTDQLSLWPEEDG